MIAPLCPAYSQATIAKGVDLHAAFDRVTKVYTIPLEQMYVVKRADGRIVRHWYLVGDTIYNPQWVIGHTCKVFFNNRSEFLK